MALTTELSLELAQLAARHIAEEGLTYGQAKRKAAKQVGVAEHNAAMPSNEVIEQALREYQQDFMADTQPAELLRLRQLAARWLAQLAAIDGLHEPCRALAVGSVVNGTAGEHSPVHIQVYTDEDKHLEIALLNAGWALEFTQAKAEGQQCPVIVIQDHGVPIVLTLLPRQRYKAVPTNLLHDHPQAASLPQLQFMMAH
jgi:hypothetical protein